MGPSPRPTPPLLGPALSYLLRGVATHVWTLRLPIQAPPAVFCRKLSLGYYLAHSRVWPNLEKMNPGQRPWEQTHGHLGWQFHSPRHPSVLWGAGGWELSPWPVDSPPCGKRPLQRWGPGQRHFSLSLRRLLLPLPYCEMLSTLISLFLILHIFFKGNHCNKE